MALSIQDTFLEAVNAGLVPGHRLIRKYGSNNSISTTNQDIWGPAGTLQWLTSAELMSVVSASPSNDNSTGTGVRSVKITGLDNSFKEISEVITLDTTPVLTVNKYIRVYRVKAESTGTYTGKNSGDITITSNVSATVQAAILAGDSQTVQTHYSIEAGHTGFIKNIRASMDTGKEITLKLHVRNGADIVTPPYKPDAHKHHWNGITEPIREKYIAGHVLEEKSDVWFDGTVSVGTAIINVDYDILVIDNRYLNKGSG